MSSLVVLVDDKDREIGQEDKLLTHKLGLKHRAFSIIIYDSKGEMLIQKRATEKYHSGGLWSNACCSHPRPGFLELGETCLRLHEEMGFTCSLKEIFHFSYKAVLDNGFIENEVDHVFLGEYGGEVKPNPLEVSDYAWVDIKTLKEEMSKHPERYTEWFKIIIDKYFDHLVKL